MKRIIFLLVAVTALATAKAQRPVVIPTPIQVNGYAHIRDSVRASIYFQGVNDTLATQAYVRSHSGAGGGIIAGYGIKIIGGDTVVFDTSGVRKLDSLYTITDSTGIFKINGHAYAFKIPGNVKSFNGRIGLVVPTRNDYRAFYPVLDSTYNDPSFINTLSWGKIFGTGHTLGSYGIFDAVLNKGNANSWQVDALANRPPPSVFGNIFMAIDANDSSIYFDNGTRWVLVAGGGSGIDSAVNNGYGLSKSVAGSTIKLTVDTTTLKTVFGSAAPGVFQIFTKWSGIVINGTDTVSADTTILMRFSDTLSKIATRNFVISRGYLTAESDPVATAKQVTINVSNGILRSGFATQTIGGSPTYGLSADTTYLSTILGLADTAAAIRSLIGAGSISQLFHKFAGITIRGTDTVDIDTTVVTRFSDTAAAKALATKTYVNAQGFLKVETDPVAVAKTISDSAGYGITIQGVTTQTIGSSPKYKTIVDTTVILPLHRLADSTAVLRAVIAAGGQALALSYGLTGSSYNGSASVTTKVDTSVIAPLHRITDTANALRATLKAIGVDSIWRTPGKDSIQFAINGRYHAILDSTFNAYYPPLDSVLLKGNVSARNAALGGFKSTTDTITALTFSNAFGKVVTQDTTTGKLYRASIYLLDTAGIKQGSSPFFNLATGTFKMTRDSVWRILGKDSLYFSFGGKNFQVLDSLGLGGGGSGSVSQVNTGFGMAGGPITTTGTVSFDSTAGASFHTQGYNDPRYHKTLLDSLAAGLIRDSTPIVHKGPLWNIYPSVTNDSVFDKGWNNTPGNAYVRTGTDSANYIILKQTIAAGTCIKCTVTYDSTGRITAVTATASTDTVYRTIGKDSIQFVINGRYHSILDSAGAGGGGSGSVTQVTPGYGLTSAPNPIVATGTISIDTTASTIHTQGYNDKRYHNTLLDSLAAGLVRDSTPIVHKGPLWNMYPSVTNDSIFDKGWNNTPGDAYIRTGTDSANYIIFKQKIAAGSCIKCTVTYDSAGRITAVSPNAGLDTLYRTIGKDSLQFTINGRYHSILDSAGGSGGGGGGGPYYPPLDSVLWKGNVSARAISVGQVTSTGTTYNATFGKVITQDTTTGILYRQAAQQVDTTGVLTGYIPTWNTNKFVMTAVLPSNNGGTGINNNGKTISVGGNLLFSGAFNTTFNVGAATNVTLPSSGTLFGSAASSFTSASLAGAISDETGTGSAVFSNTPTFIAPVLGVATATSINGLGITNTSATLSLANNFITSGSFPMTLSATASTSVQLPTTGTLYGTKANSFSSANMFASLSDHSGGSGGLVVFSLAPVFTGISSFSNGTTSLQIGQGTSGNPSILWPANNTELDLLSGGDIGMYSSAVQKMRFGINGSLLLNGVGAANRSILALHDSAQTVHGNILGTAGFAFNGDPWNFVDDVNTTASAPFTSAVHTFSAPVVNAAHTSVSYPNMFNVYVHGSPTGTGNASVNGWSLVVDGAKSSIASPIVFSANLAPTAKVEIGGSSDGSANSASLKVDQGKLLTTPEPSAIENDGHNIFYTDSSGNRIQVTNQTSSGGIFLPTKTNGSNTSSGLTDSATWSRSGNVVTVYGYFYVVGTSTGSARCFLSLPVASTLTASSLHGTGSDYSVASTSQGYTSVARLSADVTNNRVQVDFIVNVSGQSDTFYYSYQYIVR